ncbi:GntR family transcriptional regulator [Rhizobium oryziradicis]|uniref:GntR family transcriptional regulator n=1 Tax=Rhizobium oryziradicis TaxID=1867956 RepID=A0A1Q8ZWG7_9HYPH|nr:GntR family transcriptional regulator [Rhizobium oryziradicis]OLP46365.1 GntR family transcriptional regulator [Rhizobium oryziradicis]
MIKEKKRASESAKQWVYRTLRDQVMCGAVEPGLPITINGVAESLKVSAMPVREALHRLVADGALEYMDNRRVRVPDMTPVKFDEIIATRIALETLAAERALPHIETARIDMLQAIDKQLEEAYDAGDFQGATRLNIAFHRCIFEVNSGFVLLSLLDSIWVRLGPFMRAATANLAESYRVDRHAEAIAAIRDKDIEALKIAITADIQDGIGHLGRHFFLDKAKAQSIEKQ